MEVDTYDPEATPMDKYGLSTAEFASKQPLSHYLSIHRHKYIKIDYWNERGSRSSPIAVLIFAFTDVCFRRWRRTEAANDDVDRWVVDADDDTLSVYEDAVPMRGMMLSTSKDSSKGWRRYLQLASNLQWTFNCHAFVTAKLWRVEYYFNYNCQK